MEVIIRDAAVADAETIFEIYYKTWLATYPNEAHGVLVSDIEHHYKELRTPEHREKDKARIRNIGTDARMLVAEIGNTIVGTSNMVRGGERNKISSIYILPEFQGKGVGRKLFDTALLWFDKTKDIQVDVATYNTKAITFYESLGFVRTGEIFTEERFCMQSGGIIPEERMIRKHT